MDDHIVAAPRYNLSRVLKVRNMLANDTLSEFCGYAPVGPVFEEFVDSICAALPRVKRLAVWDSVRNVAGALLTDELLRMTCWRLAGNIDLLRCGTAVPTWNVQQTKEWMPVQIQSYQEGTNNRGAPGGHFMMRVMAGTACPMHLSKFWTKRFCRYIAVKLMGYSKQSGNTPLSHISELVSLRLWVNIDPELCRPSSPAFEHVGMTSGLKKWNQGIIAKRFRQDWMCPYEFDHRCHKCQVGYDLCPAATHKETNYAEAEDSGTGDGEDRDNTDGGVAEPGAGRPHVLA